VDNRLRLQASVTPQKQLSPRQLGARPDDKSRRLVIGAAPHRHEALAEARRVGRELRQLGVERRIVSQPRAKTGWDSLTDSELRVINLIAQGVTNRDVAAQLHLSLHTVKTHIRNAFAKLGINSRAELTRFVRGTD
jgi:DNA-binding CsgD family transcriptional regulator